MSKTVFTVKADLSSVEDDLKKLGLDEGGAAQAFLTSEIMRLSSDYIPFKEGILQASARISEDKKAIEYHSPYAQYHWFGKLMVDPVSKKGAFFNPNYGFWSRPNTQKELSERNMNYNGAPRRGSRWVTRCVIDNGDRFIDSVERFIERYSK